MKFVLKFFKLLFAFFTMFLSKNKERQQKLKQIDQQKNYDDWLKLVQSHDSQSDIQAWIHKEESNLYQYKYIKNIKEKLRLARQKQDVLQVCQLLRQNANRNVGNILNPKLYIHAFTRTKLLIEEFQEEFEQCLEFLYNQNFDNKKQFFQELRKAIGKTALLFSGGAIIGLYSCGVANILDKLKLLPQVMTGSSAGAILVSLVGTAVDIQKIFQPNYYDYSMFEYKQKLERLDQFKRLITKGYLMEKEQMKQFLQKAYGDLTFLEAYKKTGRIMNIMVTGKDCSSSDCLLNYITAPNVIVWSAVCCSCSLPGVYEASNLYYKNEKGEILSGDIKYVDGSISADLPMLKLAEQFNINYTIVSQTNPWVFPFLTSHRCDHSIIIKLIDKISQFILGEIKHRIQQIMKLNILPQMVIRMSNLLIQQYEGNITIWPKFLWLDYTKLLDNPDEYTVQRMKIEGQRRTFEKLNFIASATRFERCLQKYMKF